MRLATRFLVAVPVMASASLLFAQTNVSFELKQNGFLCPQGVVCQTTGATVQSDFNNDGKLDLITGVQVSNHQILYEQLGNGDGTFQAPVAVGASSPIAGGSLLAVDLNNDGILDLVASFYNGTEVDVLFGKGDGSFGPTLGLPTSTFTYTSAVTGDFNGDGRIDIAIGDNNGNIEIFQNEQNKSFVLASTLSVTKNGYLNSLASGDVDNNGYPDLAATDDTGSTYILWGTGSNFFNQVLLNTYPSARVAIGDVNQDSQGDILVTYDCNPAPPNSVGKGPQGVCTGIDVYYGQGYQATFLRHAVTDASVSTTFQPLPVDVNGDGIADLVAGALVGNNSRNGLVVWLGHPDGSFDQTAQKVLAGSGGGGSALAGDFNRDGMMDFLIGPGQLYTNATNRAPCATSQISPTVLVCQPTDNTYVSGPYVSIQATAYDKTQVTALQEYQNGRLVNSVPVTNLIVTAFGDLGTYLFVTKAWDANGVSFRSNRHVTIYKGLPGPVCAAAPNAASICLPAGTTATSPVRILANGATSSIPTAAQLYIDGRLVVNDRTQSTVVDVNQTLTAGNHELVFKLYDADGGVFTATRSVTVQ